MPGRPPKDWMRSCVAGVSASGGAMYPGAVCAATWQRKSRGEKAAMVAAEGRSMAKKKKKKAHGKKHPKKTHAKKRHGKKHVKAHKCPMCRHTARHDAKAGCLHRSASGVFCTCKHR